MHDSDWSIARMERYFSAMPAAGPEKQDQQSGRLVLNGGLGEWGPSLHTGLCGVQSAPRGRMGAGPIRFNSAAVKSAIADFANVKRPTHEPLKQSGAQMLSVSCF
jgi:hypothetical protein